MLTSITLHYTTIIKNENMQPKKITKKRTIRAEEMVIGNRTMDELGTLGFTDIRRFRTHALPQSKQSKINFVEIKGKEYKVESIKDDGSGRRVTIDVTANDGDEGETI